MATCTSADGSCGKPSNMTSLGILLVRLILGIIFIYYGGQHGFGLFGGRGMASFSRQIASDHFPILPAIVWAWMSAGTEFFGGILMILGVVSRIVGVLLIIDMLVAMWVFRAGGFGSVDFNLALVSMAGLVLIAGPGRIAIDALIFRGCCGKPKSPGSAGAA